MAPNIRLLVLAALLFVDVSYVSASSAPNVTATPERGQLLDNPPIKLGSYTPSELIDKVTSGELSQRLLRRTFSPRCSAGIYQLRYGTVGAKEEPAAASGALMVPEGNDPVCQGPRPIVLYAHGKRNLKGTNLADFSGQNYEALLLALALTGDGYIVVAPNYAGYDSSTLDYHPFLNADQQSSEMMDALTAARTALLAYNIADNQKLFVTGYSQGGYVAMATHRAFQDAGIPVTASAPMSGPYAMSAFADAVFMGQVSAGAVEQVAMVVSSYQNAYGNLYSDPKELFEEKYAGAASLLPGTTAGSALVEQGLLPDNAVFSITPPAPEFAAFTPAIEPGRFSAVFARGFGTDHLIRNDYRLRYLQDAVANPDGGFPNTTDNLPPANPAHPLRQALLNNDLRNWAPTSPMLLCAGDDDPVVFYLNTQLMQGYWAVNAPHSPVTILNIDAPPSQGGQYRRLMRRFAETKDWIKWFAKLQGKDERAEVLKDYHDVLVPAYCVQAARSFFDSH
jgi:alpha/beta superfamily hydrolase